MSRVSFTEVWDQTRAFVASELSLLAPVALTCFAMPLLLLSIVMPDPPATTEIGKTAELGTLMLWSIPLFFIQMFGWLTLMALTLVPAISVGEALRRALTRMPRALGVLAVMILVAFILVSAAAVVSAVFGVLPGVGKNGGVAIAVVALAVCVVIMTVRLSLLWPSVVDSEDGPIKALRRSVRLTAGEFWHLFGLLLLAMAVSALLSATAQLAGGSVMLLIGRMAQSEALGRTLALVLNAIVVSLWQMVTVVYIALLYRAFVRAGKAG